jgi:hypothetical protein
MIAWETIPIPVREIISGVVGGRTFVLIRVFKHIWIKKNFNNCIRFVGSQK